MNGEKNVPCPKFTETFAHTLDLGLHRNIRPASSQIVGRQTLHTRGAHDLRELSITREEFSEHRRLQMETLTLRIH